MADEQWRLIRAFRTENERGEPTEMIVGLVETSTGAVEPAIKVDGKVALIPLEEIGMKLPEVIREVLVDWWKREGGR